MTLKEPDRMLVSNICPYFNTDFFSFHRNANHTAPTKNKPAIA